MIKQSEDFEIYKRNKKAMYDDELTQSMLKEFNRMKERIMKMSNVLVDTILIIVK